MSGIKDGLKTLAAPGNTAIFKGLEVFDAAGPCDVEHVTRELVGRCPVTKQPDFYTVTLRVHECSKHIETKSLKLYFGELMGVEMFAEHLAVKIARDVGAAVGAGMVLVTLEQNPRGGIATKACASWPTCAADITGAAR